MSTVASTGPALNPSTVADALSAGNGTIAITGQPYRGSGIIVAIPAHAAIYNVSEFDAAQVQFLTRLWVEENAHAITSHPAPFYNPRYFGSWRNGEWLHLDIVEAFPREELTDAIAAGISRNQIAIWDNGRQEEIVTGAVD